MKSAAIYARVSTEEQARNTSIMGQVEACRDYAQAQGYTIIHEVREDFSGARLDRPGLTQIRDMAERGDIAAAIVYDPDRLSRSNAHTWMLMDEFERRGVPLLFVNMPREDTPEGKMLFGMRTLFAEYEREKIKDRTRRGRERSARNGQVLSSAACAYGYTYFGGPGLGRLEIKEDEALVVRMLFQWLVNDRMPMTQMVQRLQAMGVPTKRGGNWTRSTLHGIFSNETYTGTFYWNRHKSVLPKNGKAGRKTEKSSLVLKDRNEWIPVPVPAIIDREVFEGAGRQLRLNAERSQRNTKTPYLLRTMVMCAMCGHLYYCSTRYDDGRRHYKCRGRAGDTWQVSGQKCTNVTFKGDVLEQIVWDKLTDYLSDPKRIAVGIEGKDATIQQERRREERELESAVVALQTVEREEARLLYAYQQSVIDLPKLQEALVELKKRKDELTTEREKISARSRQRSKWIADLRAIEAVSVQARSGFQRMSFERRRAVLEVMNIQVQVHPDRLEITGLLTDNLTILLQEPKRVDPSAIASTNLIACGGCACS